MRETKHTYRQAPGTRDHITVLACFNAAGEDVPPFIIYKGGAPGDSKTRLESPTLSMGSPRQGGFRRCGLYPLDPKAIDWSRVMPSGPQHWTPSLPPPAPAQPPLALPPHLESPPSSPPHPPSPPLPPSPRLSMAQPDVISSHPLVMTLGQIPTDLSDLLAEVKFARNNGRARRNIN
ncbi:hypothetical protein WMY93_018651 [Mugilogobius chulae]|uniref:Uncharacterized protein n=1 Tax=Mugilogobius chulae TaxID=88201 RepID=A0AAW0NVI6_9GOBI